MIRRWRKMKNKEQIKQRVLQRYRQIINPCDTVLIDLTLEEVEDGKS